MIYNDIWNEIINIQHVSDLFTSNDILMKWILTCQKPREHISGILGLFWRSTFLVNPSTHHQWMLLVAGSSVPV